MKRVVFDFTDEEAARYEKSHGTLEKFLQAAIDNEREALKVEVKGGQDANEDDKPEQKLKTKQSK